MRREFGEEYRSDNHRTARCGKTFRPRLMCRLAQGRRRSDAFARASYGRVIKVQRPEHVGGRAFRVSARCIFHGPSGPSRLCRLGDFGTPRSRETLGARLATTECLCVESPISINANAQGGHRWDSRNASALTHRESPRLGAGCGARGSACHVLLNVRRTAGREVRSLT